MAYYEVTNGQTSHDTVLNNNDCIERYYYWNEERDPSKLYKNGSLTAAGKYYATINSGLGYNGKYDFVPTTPPQYGPSKFTQKVVSTGKTRLTWHDSNGEYNQLMEVQMKDARGLWVVLDTIAQKESAANYSYDVDNDDEDVLYRLHLIDLNGKEYYTYDQLELGDAFEIDGQLFYAGGNLFPNGQFDLGFTDWTSGIGKPLAEPQFQIVGDGGFNGGSYLQSHLNGSAGHASSVKTAVELQEGQQYVFRIATRNGSNYIKFSLSADGKTLLSRAGTYEITYTVADDEGHVSQRSRTVTVEPNTSYEAAGLPICMYHYVYDANDPPADVNSRYKNYISQQDLIEEMNWLNEEGYYYPTWKEVRDYFWEGGQVSESGYRDGINFLFDSSRARTCQGDQLMTAAQLQEKLR